MYIFRAFDIRIAEYNKVGPDSIYIKLDTDWLTSTDIIYNNNEDYPEYLKDLKEQISNMRSHDGHRLNSKRLAPYQLHFGLTHNLDGWIMELVSGETGKYPNTGVDRHYFNY